MSETKALRAIEEVQKDYSSEAMKLGDIEYKVKVFKSEAEAAIKRMYDLNIEGKAIQDAKVDTAKAIVTPETVQ